MIYLFNFSYTALAPSTVAPAFYSACLQSPLEGWGLSDTAYFRQSGVTQEKGGGEEHSLNKRQKYTFACWLGTRQVRSATSGIDTTPRPRVDNKSFKKKIHTINPSRAPFFLATKVVSSAHDVIDNGRKIALSTSW